MHRKIAGRYITKNLCDLLQRAVSDANIQLHKLKGMTSRATSLIEESEHKDHIYREAGDMIFTYQSTLEHLQEQLSTISYTVERLSLQAAADKLKPPVKEEIDKAFSSNDEEA
jgi:chaperonin cofactor prefoldin